MRLSRHRPGGGFCRPSPFLPPPGLAHRRERSEGDDRVLCGHCLRLMGRLVHEPNHQTSARTGPSGVGYEKPDMRRPIEHNGNNVKGILGMGWRRGVKAGIHPRSHVPQGVFLHRNRSNKRSRRPTRTPKPALHRSKLPMNRGRHWRFRTSRTGRF